VELAASAPEGTCLDSILPERSGENLPHRTVRPRSALQARLKVDSEARAATAPATMALPAMVEELRTQVSPIEA
jgi:hypothetical protein